MPDYEEPDLIQGQGHKSQGHSQPANHHEPCVNHLGQSRTFNAKREDKEPKLRHLPRSAIELRALELDSCRDNKIQPMVGGDNLRAFAKRQRNAMTEVGTEEIFGMRNMPAASRIVSKTFPKLV